MGAWIDRDMAPDDALLHRLLDELERTNRELDEVTQRLRQVDINVARLDRVEEGMNKLTRRVEGEDGLSERVAILFDAAHKTAVAKAASDSPSKAVLGLIATLIGLAGAIAVEFLRALRAWLGLGS